MALDRPSSRATLAVARLLALAAVLASLTAVALPLLGGRDYLLELFRTPEPVAGPAFAVTGALLVAAPAARRIGWLMLAIGVATAVYAVSTSALAWRVGLGLPGGPVVPGELTGPTAVVAWLRTWTWLPGLLLVTTVLPYVVPAGRLPGGRWRAALLTGWALLGAGTVLLAFAPAESDVVPGLVNPLASDAVEAAGAVVVPVGALLGVGLAVGGLVSLVVRFVRADGVERRQLGWFGYGVAAAVLTTAFAPWWGVALGVLLVPAGLAVAATRYRLYDLDVLVNRTLVAAALLAVTALVYAAVVGWAGGLLGRSASGTAAFTAAFSVALVFHPARLHIQRGVDRLLHGERGDPYALLTSVDAALREAASPREALHEGAAAVARGLRLRGAAVEVALRTGEVVRAQVGEVPDGAEQVELTLLGENVGRLLASPRAASDRLDATDRRVLAGLAGPLASAAYALRLAGDLEDSRGQLVTAREEERRRLRRDLHDGLGPQLSAVVMCLDTASAALRRADAERAAGLVDTARDTARDAVGDIRRLVHGLRPPALDDLGLVQALQTTGVAAQEGGPVVTVTADGALDALPAALEVAVFRIVQEALTNAVRHAGAAHVDVRLAAGPDSVVVEVADDGRGLPAERVAGVGVVSMRERAAELGGHCTLSSDARGTTVRAVLPRASVPQQRTAEVQA